MDEPLREQIYSEAVTNRLLAADMFASLSADEWTTPSLCAGWTVREIAAHLVDPLEDEVSVPRLLLMLVRYRGSLDRMVDEGTRRAAQRPTDELVVDLRRLAGTRFDPPVVGPLGPMTDTCVHLRDAARPLGRDVDVSPTSWRLALDFLTSKPATRGFLPRNRLPGLHLVATDQEWEHGAGEEVSGPSEALAMAVSGRAVALAELSGPGADLLRSRLSAG